MWEAAKAAVGHIANSNHLLSRNLFSSKLVRVARPHNSARTDVVWRWPSRLPLDCLWLVLASHAQVEGTIELKNVKFSYPARLDVPVFEDISLTIPAGKTVALVGESGSGKSTVVSLIERFYDPLGGQVGA